MGTLQANALVFTQIIFKRAKRGRTNVYSSINQWQCVVWLLFGSWRGQTKCKTISVRESREFEHRLNIWCSSLFTVNLGGWNNGTGAVSNSYSYFKKQSPYFFWDICWNIIDGMAQCLGSALKQSRGKWWSRYGYASCTSRLVMSSKTLKLSNGQLTAHNLIWIMHVRNLPEYKVKTRQRHTSAREYLGLTEITNMLVQARPAEP